MTRSRLESLLLSFPKLIPPGAQHTTLLSPDGSIRYVYMPVDELYVCLLTPPLSNILQDIETLHLLGRIVTEMCSAGTVRGGVGESEILRNAFELLSSFDEVISLGYRERVGMTEVRAAMEMESHEERIQEIIARNKEQEAKEELKRRAKQLEMQRREMLRQGKNPYVAGGCASAMPTSISEFSDCFLLTALACPQLSLASTDHMFRRQRKYRTSEETLVVRFHSTYSLLFAAVVT